METYLDGDASPGGAAASEKSWYVVHVMPHPVDFFARRFIGQLGIEYLHLTELRRRPRKKPLRVASLPGYLFVRFDRAREPWQMIYQAPGVIEILSSDEGNPVAITDEEMEIVLEMHHQRFSEKGREWYWPSWKIGQELLVVRGPLAGVRCAFVAFVRKAMPKAGREIGGDAANYVKAIVDSFGRKVIARFNISDLQPAPRAAA